MNIWDWFRDRQSFGRRAVVDEEAALVRAVHEDDGSERVQAAMLGKEHEPVLELEKQATAPLFVLGAKKPLP